MSRQIVKKIISEDIKDTERIGAEIGTKLRGGEVIELISDVGGGKTTLTRGIVRGAGSTDCVASPTFTISREYRAPNFRILHFDFYRLDDPGLVAVELEEYLEDKEAVVIIEWADSVQHLLSNACLRVRIMPVKDSDIRRELVLDIPPQLGYVVEGL